MKHNGIVGVRAAAPHWHHDVHCVYVEIMIRPMYLDTLYNLRRRMLRCPFFQRDPAGERMHGAPYFSDNGFF